MKRTQQIVMLIISGMACATLQADTLELADGTLIEGDMVGSSNNIIMFNTGEEIEAYPESEVVGKSPNASSPTKTCSPRQFHSRKSPRQS